MEITIKHNHGHFTMRKPFFPCPLRKLKSLILPLLLEDPQGERVREEMAAYCDQQSWIAYKEAKQVFTESQQEIEKLEEADKPAFRKRTSRKVKHLQNLAIRYKRNAEVIRG